jgi:hypothetical protein
MTMGNRAAAIRKADVERTVKGVIAGGLKVARVEVEGGKMVFYTSDGEALESPLEVWRRKDGKS